MRSSLRWTPPRTKSDFDLYFPEWKCLSDDRRRDYRFDSTKHANDVLPNLFLTCRFCCRPAAEVAADITATKAGAVDFLQKPVSRTSWYCTCPKRTVLRRLPALTEDQDRDS